MQYLTELIKRLGSTSPKFFKAMQIASLILACVSGAALYLLQKELWVPDKADVWKEITQTVSTFFGGTLFAALTTTTDAKLQDPKTVQNILKEK